MRSSSTIFVISSCLLAVYIGVVLAASTSNPLSVEDLPGYQGDAPDLDMYTGYITVDENHGRNLFYWHVKSLNDPANDPLVFWYNGGPGCSGLGGFFTENGPFTVNSNLSLVYNTLHWANIANVVWLEQPAGVGFSYSEDLNDYFTNDTRAAQDNYAFIQGFLELYPEYQSTNIWLAGESYAGIYIPTLTSVILDGPNQYVKNQLTGLMLGNPVNLCPAFDYVSVQYNIYYWHGLVSPSNYQNWTNSNCDIDASSETCNEIFNIAQEQIGSIVQELTPFDNEPSLDPDDLYQDFCTGNGTLEFSLDINDTIDSCYPVGQRVQDYLNQDEVQTVLTAVPTKWVDCTNNINYTSENLNMNPHLQQAFSAGLQVLIYAGDVDIATVPAWYTVPCINTLGSNVIEEWQPWFVNGATAGYVTVYEDFTWATLKGAGHEAPEYQPLDAYNLFSRFLNGDSGLGDAAAPRKVDLSKARLAERLLTQGMQARKIYAGSRRS